MSTTEASPESVLANLGDKANQVQAAKERYDKLKQKSKAAKELWETMSQELFDELRKVTEPLPIFEQQSDGNSKSNVRLLEQKEESA